MTAQEITDTDTEQSASTDTASTTALKPMPTVRPITSAAIGDALGAGLKDFQAAPVYGLFFGAVYALGGLAIVFAAFFLDLGWLPYPLGAGFAILGPFAAVGLYEVSRRRESGEPLSWGAVLGVMFRARTTDLGFMAFVTLFIFVIWMYQIRILLALFLGFEPITSPTDFLATLVTTTSGFAFLAVGTLIGAILALFVYAVTVVSFPLLLDREADFVTAIITSIRAVLTSPGPMLGWGVVVTIALLAASLPAFLGIIIVLPVLGHATWHLYRALVVPEGAAEETT